MLRNTLVNLPRIAFFVLLLTGLAALSARAETRVALVIGNGAYQHAPKLPNPANDAADVASALRRLGFETVLATDLDRSAMDEATIRFARAARTADVALFYYSGHAIQFANTNYLLPVDTQLTDEADLRRLIKVDDVVSDLQQARNLRIIVLDSCRSNPLADQLRQSIGATRGVSLQRGLARIDRQEGMIVSYATQADRTADDGSGRNSPYTAAFLKNIETPEEIGTIFRRIGTDVYNSTRHEQFPELSLSLIGEYYLRDKPAQVATAAPQPLPAPTPTPPLPSPPQPARTAALPPPTPAPAPPTTRSNDPLIARVNGLEIRESDVALAEQELGSSLDKMDPATKRTNVINYLIDMKVVANSPAAKATEGTSESFRKNFDFSQKRLLMDALLTRLGKDAATDDAIKKVYDDAARQITGEQEVHARHILVGTENEARQIEDALKNGADFADLARKKSKDPSASNGGDLGFFTKDQMVPEFSAVAFALAPGKISDPVKTQFGWHIIKIEEKRNRKPPDFAETRSQVENYVVRKAQADYIAQLRDGARIERFDLDTKR